MSLPDFNNGSHRILSAAVIAALTDVAAQHGVTFKASGGIAGSTSGMIKLDVTLTQVAGAKSQAQLQWEMYCRQFGFEKEDFGRLFATTQGTYRISGIKPSAPKFPILADEIHGRKRTYKFQTYSVRNGLPKNAAKAA